MSVSLDKPKHRLTISGMYTFDPDSRARCEDELGKYTLPTCHGRGLYCPQHSPTGYADVMAQHAGGPNPSYGTAWAKSGYVRKEVSW